MARSFPGELNMSTKLKTSLTLAALLVLTGLSGPAANAETAIKTASVGSSTMVYPQALKADKVDVYNGTSVADPYRWLEDSDSPQTRKWIEAENAITRPFLDSIPERKSIHSRLTELWNYERCGAPIKRAERLIYSKNNGLQNQNVLYVKDTPQAQARVLIDPNKLSTDGTINLAGFHVTDDGKLMAYGLSTSGSDWQIWHVKDVVTSEDTKDELHWLKNASVAWLKDGSGFYYGRYDEPKAGTELTAVNYFQKLFFHKLGTPQAQDKLIYQRPDDKELEFEPIVTDDGRYLIINVYHGTSPKNGVLIKDLSTATNKFVDFFPLGKATYNIAGNEGHKFWVLTDEKAPKARIISVDFNADGQPPSNTVEIVKESNDTLEGASIINEKLLCSYMKDAHSAIRFFDLKGTLDHELELPGIGRATGFDARQHDKETYYAYTSYNSPSTIFHLNLANYSQDIFFKPQCKFNPDDFTTEQIFYTSKDGTKVPMFVSYKKGLQRDGNNATYLYGYGGFKISLLPSFSVTNLLWMERGGILAIPSLRGGGEYGEDWHSAGMKVNKQTVFDDFISAAQALIDKKYTRSEKLAIGGGSNGGLLVGACITQRPDLYGAAIPAVGVMDMLRFNKFTVGWGWVQEYGSPENVDEFKALYKYSPLHNIKPGTCYPATLITTADHDDRVVPGHSFKFAAALQAAQGCAKPILIRIDTKAGHGHGKPTAKIIDEAADEWAFLVHELHMQQPL